MAPDKQYHGLVLNSHIWSSVCCYWQLLSHHRHVSDYNSDIFLYFLCLGCMEGGEDKPCGYSCSWLGQSCGSLQRCHGGKCQWKTCKFQREHPDVYWTLGPMWWLLTRQFDMIQSLFVVWLWWKGFPRALFFSRHFDLLVVFRFPCDIRFSHGTKVSLF